MITACFRKMILANEPFLLFIQRVLRELKSELNESADSSRSEESSSRYNEGNPNERYLCEYCEYCGMGFESEIMLNMVKMNAKGSDKSEESCVSAKDRKQWCHESFKGNEKRSTFY